MHQEIRQPQISVVGVVLGLVWFVPFSLALSLVSGVLGLVLAFDGKPQDAVGALLFILLFVLDTAALVRVVVIAVRVLRGQSPGQHFTSEVLMFSLLLLFANYGLGALALGQFVDLSMLD